MASVPHELANPVYLVGNRALSILDLLRRFSEPEYQANGISRISDLHLKVGEPARYRFDNELVPLLDAAPLTDKVLRDLLFPLLTHAQIARLTDEHGATDIDAGFESAELDANFRINAFHDREGIACAIRALPRRVPPVEEIGFPSAKLWRDLTQLQQGLVLVTGTTGSGKSTTIASMLRHIAGNRRVRIITLEDPIEYTFVSDKALISQRELGRHVSSFQQGLRSALREDPDVIFVGEMRDPETTFLAMTAAETGHLVFSTLHTRDTRGAITRIVDMYPPERTKEIATQLSFSLHTILGQRLVRRADGRGRRAAMEVLRNISPVAHLIRAGNWQQLYSTLQTQAQYGLGTLEMHLKELVAAGEVTRDEAIRNANVPSALEG
ncbi:MAG: PilT/PilU family type 4a pilus ATPase [Planctomycetes bacterium]|nr:PilT/PilU family type 4a pilus ATPase [Planctomycetota bacterium]